MQSTRKSTIRPILRGKSVLRNPVQKFKYKNRTGFPFGGTTGYSVGGRVELTDKE